MEIENYSSLDTLAQEKLDADTEFQTSLATLPDEDKENAIKEKKSAIIDEEIRSLSVGRKKAEEIAENQKKRAEKAEKEKKLEPAGGDTPKNEGGLSTKDVLFLAKAEIHEEDMDEVLEWAALKKVPVSEAFKQMKPILDVRSEERKTAEVANVNNVRRGPTKVTDETLLSDANAGKLPESDADITRLFQARAKQGRK